MEKVNTFGKMVRTMRVIFQKAFDKDLGSGMSQTK
jgi:hypothetical protein